MFQGFTEDTVRFFLDLRFHNNTAWFHEHHEEYRKIVVQPFYELIEDLTPAMLAVDPRLEFRPHKCLSRINRDIRFTKDKSPYRDHLWFTFRPAGEEREGSLNFWFEFGPDRLDWGFGFWGENREVMDTFRRRLEARPQEFIDLARKCDFPGNRVGLSGRMWKKLAVPESLPEVLRPWYLSRELLLPRMDVDYAQAFRPDLKDAVEATFLTCAPVYRYLRGMQTE